MQGLDKIEVFMKLLRQLMKKFALLSIITPFLAASKAVAQEIIINAPKDPQGKGYGYSDLGVFVTNVLILAFSIALLVVLAMLIWGAFEWIASGGDKEAVGKARNRIINALIGLAVLAVAFALTTVAGQFLGFSLGKIPIPTPPPPSP